MRAPISPQRGKSLEVHAPVSPQQESKVRSPACVAVRKGQVLMTRGRAGWENTAHSWAAITYSTRAPAASIVPEIEERAE